MPHQSEPDTTRSGATFSLLLGPAVAVAILAFFDLTPGNSSPTACAAVASWMAIWWIAEPIPLAATALLPVVLFPLFGILDATTTTSQYTNDVIFLFLGGFVMALALERWNLHRRIALFALIRTGPNPRRILLSFMIVTGFLSMWISNTAATMMMVSIALAIVSQLEELHGPEHVKRYTTGLLISVAYGASIGGIATLVGTPPNTSFRRIFELLYPSAPELSFAQWAMFGVPTSFVLLVVAFITLTCMFPPPRDGIQIDVSHLKETYSALGKMSVAEKRVAVLFATLVFLWIFRKDIELGVVTIPGWADLLPHGKLLQDGTVATFVALLLFAIPSSGATSPRLMDWPTASRLPWNIILLFGGGFALARGFISSGLASYIGDTLQGFSGVPPMLLVVSLCAGVTFLTELTSNTATAEMLLPILGSTATGIQMNPLLLMVPVTISCSCAFMMPVATPPNAIIFGTQRVRGVDLAKTGVILNLMGAAIITALTFTVGRVVFDIDLDVFPDWARSAGSGH